MQTHYAVLRQKKMARHLPYVAHIARACSLEAISNLTREYIPPHHPVSLQHPIPSKSHTQHLYSLIHDRSVLSSNDSIFPPIIHYPRVSTHPHLPSNHHCSIPRAASRRRHVSLNPLPRSSNIDKHKSATRTQSQNIRRTPRNFRHVPCWGRSLG